MDDTCPECYANSKVTDTGGEEYGDGACSWTEYECPDCGCKFRRGWVSQDHEEILEHGLEFDKDE